MVRRTEKESAWHQRVLTEVCWMASLVTRCSMRDVNGRIGL